MKKCCIFGSAPISDYSGIDLSGCDYIIAADGGYDHLKKIGAVPDLILGDFDSVKNVLPTDSSIVTVPSQKDDTDLMLAAKTALEKGYKRLDMYGVLGGRLDHTLANIQMLEFICDNGGEGVLFGDNDIVRLQGKGKKSYRRLDGYYFSIFALTDKTTVTTRGTKYNLDNYTLTRDFSLGVSNEIFEDYAKTEVFEGLLLVIFSKKR